MATIRARHRAAPSRRSSGVGSRSSSSQPLARRRRCRPTAIAIGVTTRKKIAERHQVDDPLLGLVLDVGRGGSTQTPIANTIAAPSRLAITSETPSRSCVRRARSAPGLVGARDQPGERVAPGVGHRPSLVGGGGCATSSASRPSCAAGARPRAALRPAATGGVPARICSSRRAANSPWSSPSR